MSLGLDFVVEHAGRGDVDLIGKLHPFDASAAKYMEFCDEEDMIDMYGPLNLHEKLAVFCPLNDA